MIFCMHPVQEEKTNVPMNLFIRKDRIYNNYNCLCHNYLDYLLKFNRSSKLSLHDASFHVLILSKKKPLH